MNRIMQRYHAPITVIILANLLMVIFILFQSGIDMGMDGYMRCPFMPGSNACDMSLGVHLSMWERIFMATFQESTRLLSMLALVLVSSLIAREKWFVLERIRNSGRLYIKEHPHIPLFVPLRESFSRGILHPKLRSVIAT